MNFQAQGRYTRWQPGATTAITMKEPRIQKKKTVKERNLQRINRGKVMVVAQNNHNSQPSIRVKPECSDVDAELSEQKHWQESKPRRIKKTTQMQTKRDLVDVMMKLEGIRPMCWILDQSGCLNNTSWIISKPIESLLKKNTGRSQQRTAKSCGAHVFGVHRTYICNSVTEDVKKRPELYPVECTIPIPALIIADECLLDKSVNTGVHTFEFCDEPQR